jgi:hypothetical protein
MIDRRDGMCRNRIKDVIENLHVIESLHVAPNKLGEE